MSTHSISIVPAVLEYENRKEKANEILDWLVEADIVKKNLSDCILSERGGYSMSAGAKLIVCRTEDLFFDQTINGLEILTEKTVFDTGEYGLDSCLCPNCQYNNNVKAYFEIIENWYTRNQSTSLCPQCHNLISVQAWQTNPTWGLSDLGFTFWNWPMFTEEFLNDFSKRLDAELKIIHRHL